MRGDFFPTWAAARLGKEQHDTGVPGVHPIGQGAALVPVGSPDAALGAPGRGGHPPRLREVHWKGDVIRAAGTPSVPALVPPLHPEEDAGEGPRHTPTANSRPREEYEPMAPFDPILVYLISGL